MLQFVVRNDGPEPDSVVLCSQFPLRIGRAAEADLQIESPGVWDFHAEVSKEESSGKYFIRSVGDALLRVNGEPSSARVISPGDEIQMGGALLRVSLSPVIQKSVRGREALVWVLVGLAFLAEGALLVLFR